MGNVDHKLMPRMAPGKAQWTVKLRRGEYGPLFGLRLFAAVLITFAVIGLIEYALMAHQLRNAEVARYSEVLRSDVRGLEAIADRAQSQAEVIREIDEVLDTIGQRPGTIDTLLIDTHHVVRASGTDEALSGTTHNPAKLDAALRGTPYAGADTDLHGDRRDFQFIVPVDLRGQRFAYEVSYNRHVLNRNIDEARQALVLAGLLSLIIGGGVFYLAGGRSLLRSHRIALERATRDGLTDLPNHRAFQDEIELAVDSATRRREPLALVVFDVNDFKDYNDRYGHDEGDILLRRVAGTLRTGRVEDRAYRIGSDEFAMVMPRVDAPGARVMVRKLVHEFRGAGTIVSVGISDVAVGGTADGVRAEVDAALAEARRRGGGIVEFDEIRARINLTTAEQCAAVRGLIAKRGVCTLFQPIWDLETNALLAVEALTRPDPDYGIDGPVEVFDIAEQIGRVRELDELCVTNALQIAPDLPDGVLLFVNLSPQTLDLDADGNDWLLESVERAGLEPRQLVVEVTERLGGRTEAVIASVRRLRDHGFGIAIDDVGAGNSGLEMLRAVGADYVKIDRSVVVAAASEPSARAVLMAMATYAHHTGSFVIAEGIEDRDTLDFLHDVEDGVAPGERVIRGGQGFGLGRPHAHLPKGAPGLLLSAEVVRSLRGGSVATA